MGTRYIMHVSDADDVNAKLAQMNSDQATLLTALGLVLDKGTSGFNNAWRLTRTAESNGFTLCGGTTGGILSLNESGDTIASTNATGSYNNFIFTEKSIMIANFSAESPTTGAASVFAVTKNDDGSIILICTYKTTSSPNYGKLYIKEKNFGAVGNIPWFYERKDPVCGNFSQYAFANLPLQMPGTVCDNAFDVLCMQTTVFADLVFINGVEYAVATDGYSAYACR